MSEGARILLDLPVEYGWVLLCAALMGLSCILIGFVFAGGARAKVFTEDYLKENFGAEHLRVTGGYPDTGSGFYTRNLDYEKWYLLNNGQRAHINFVEWIATNISLMLIAGLYFPITSAALGFGLIVSRFVYAFGYTNNGPAGRSIGALFNDLITLVHLVLAIVCSVKFLNGTKF